jgi:dCTP deaminase
VDLRLKSSTARMGWNHSLAFWVDPGWSGVLTMEVQNISKGPLRLTYGQRFAQIIVHELSSLTGEHSYQGRYQGATTVEAAKP